MATGQAILDFNDFKSQVIYTQPNSDVVKAMNVSYVSCDNLVVRTSATIASGVTVTNTPSTITLIGANNQIGFQPSNAGTVLFLSATNPAGSSRTVTFPDPGANVNVVYDSVASTISGAKTFTALATFTAASNAAAIAVTGNGSGDAVTITAGAGTGKGLVVVGGIGSA